MTKISISTHSSKKKENLFLFKKNRNPTTLFLFKKKGNPTTLLMSKKKENPKMQERKVRAFPMKTRLKIKRARTR